LGLKLFFDSSVLVPIFYADHQHHEPSAAAFLNAGKEDFCALHTLAEVYTTLTGLPVRPRIAGPEGVAIVKQIRERLTIISLSEQEYVETLETASPAIVGNAAYDALIARCAVKAGAAVLLTWNVKHFMRLGTDVARIVKTPAEFKRLQIP
jgi:predicted nucleic acid-binding protein